MPEKATDENQPDCPGSGCSERLKIQAHPRPGEFEMSRGVIPPRAPGYGWAGNREPLFLRLGGPHRIGALQQEVTELGGAGDTENNLPRPPRSRRSRRLSGPPGWRRCWQAVGSAARWRRQRPESQSSNRTGSAGRKGTFCFFGPPWKTRRHPTALPCRGSGEK